MIDPATKVCLVHIVFGKPLWSVGIRLAIQKKALRALRVT